MDISEFDYELPTELIAQHPLSQRDASRMLVIDRQSETWKDSNFATLPEYLRPLDVLVLNNTKVFPARLNAKRVPSGGSIELLLVRRVERNVWEVLGKPARRLKTGSRFSLVDSPMEGEVIGEVDETRRLIRFETKEDLMGLIEKVGEPPLPPYIKRPDRGLAEDRERYQTVYATTPGAIAAPTAGLHFTQSTFDQIRERGVSMVELTLHVGYGTFEPVRVDDVTQHRVAAERFSISKQAATAINSRRVAGGRVVAVGTTTTRALESSVTTSGEIRCSPMRETELTIVPDYKFRAVDALLTNFHLPRSSLLMLVSAFAGRELVLASYRHAVRELYRFYSYGDCMLIV
jgi:S-adenosylmethionine:tRNA ribosyltransferase-isomerase